MNRALVWFLLFALAWVAGCREHIAKPRAQEDVSPKQVQKAAETFTSDSDFVQKVAREARAQVEFGQLAQSKAQDPAVKAYAQQIVKDSTQLLGELEKLAQRQSLTLPSDLDSSQTEMKSKLDSDSGSDFDKDYVRAEIDAHQNMINLLEGAIHKSQNPQVKDFSTVNLISIRDHLDAAQMLAKKVRAS